MLFLFKVLNISLAKRYRLQMYACATGGTQRATWNFACTNGGTRRAERVNVKNKSHKNQLLSKNENILAAIYPPTAIILWKEVKFAKKVFFIPVL